MEFKPKKQGAPMINFKCSECGAYFSEALGHTCNGDYVKYRREKLRDNVRPMSAEEWRR